MKKITKRYLVKTIVHKLRKGGTLKKMNCNPQTRGKTINKDTCYTKNALLIVKEAYDKENPRNKIRGKSPHQIIEELNHKIPKCRSEDCWIEQTPVRNRNKLLNQLFAPYQPKEWKQNPTEWLSNIDILNVLKQYEKTYRDFKFIGPTSIDFDTVIDSQCVSEELCHIDLQELTKSGINKIGIIFNLDRHDESGSHWVSMFINIKERFLFYFDSAAGPTPVEIQKLIDLLLQQSANLNQKLTYYTNYPNQHQRGNTECGMYSLYFIITMLEDNVRSTKTKINLFKKKKIADKFVESFRNKYFNKS